MDKISHFLISEKIPTIVCATACMASVLIGFMMGYIFFGTNESNFAYADTATVYQSGAPSYLTASYYESFEPSAHYPAPSHAPPTPDEDKPSHLFVVTMLDGYLVVYHAEEYGGGLKEMTSTFVGALAPEEQAKLAAGIRIYSDEALARILQDYGS